jgi:hypothetical protein
MSDDFPPLRGITGRILDARDRITAEPPEDISFQHAILAQVALPRRDVKAPVWERIVGAAALRVEAGALWSGQKWIQQPIPYGTRARLALIHLSTEAVRTRSPEVDMGSAYGFMSELGIMPSGPGYGSLKKQLKAISACTMALGWSSTSGDSVVTTHRFQPIDTFEAWTVREGTQTELWPSRIQLSQRFFETLCQHAVPLDKRALAALTHTALGLDIYTWLAHRLHRVRFGGTKVPWSKLHEQFGGPHDSRGFKKEFRRALRQVAAVYPEARIEEEPGGLMLRPSPPPVPKRQVEVTQLPKARRS